MTGRTNAAGGVRLPELANPAGAAQILSGYEAINADGEAMVGTLVVQEPVYGKWDESMVSSVGFNSFTITMPSNIGTLLGLSFGGTQQPSVIGYYILGMDAGFALPIQFPTVVSIQISTSGKKIKLTLNSSTGISAEAFTDGGRYCYLPA